MPFGWRWRERRRAACEPLWSGSGLGAYPRSNQKTSAKMAMDSWISWAPQMTGMFNAQINQAARLP